MAFSRTSHRKMPANVDDIERNTLPVIYNVNPSTVM